MIVGVDVGSQSLKAVLLDSRLRVLGRGRRAYGIDFPRPGWAEQDPLRWETALGPAIADALTAGRCDPRNVVALGVAGQLDGCVAVDGAGNPLGPCLIWMDRRAEALVEAVRRRLSPDAARRRTGCVLDATHMAPKASWLLEHGSGSRAACFHQPVSYLVERLTGARVIDHALASTTLVYDLAEAGFAADLLSVFGLDRGSLPALGNADEPAGRLTGTGSALAGLPEGIPVAVGTGDDFSTPLGAGVMSTGIVVDVLGTAEVVGALHPHLLVDEGGLLETHRYMRSDLHYVENPGWVSGGALEWLRAMLGVADFGRFDELAEAAPPGCEGLLFLPALGGAMTPEWIAGARGCFYGLTPAHGRAALARAVLEGTAFGLRDIVARLREMGIAAERVRVLGGGARSRLWARIRADLTGLPVERVGEADSSAVGAGMLAAVAAGRVADLAAAARLVEIVTDVVEPQAAQRACYDEAYGRYRLLFRSLKPMFADA